MRYLATLVLLAVSVIGSSVLAQDGLPDDLVTLEHDGLERVFIQRLPERDSAPLLVVLHDVGSSARAMQMMTGLDVYADEAGFAVIYPQSADYSWDDGRVAAGFRNILLPTDDLGFIEAAVQHMAAEHSIDRKAVYLVGMGDGGSMAFRLACEAEFDVVGVAMLGASLWAHQTEQCDDETSSFDVLMVNGLLDTAYPFEGRVFPGPTGAAILPAEETFQSWANLMGCDAEAAVAEGGYTGYVETCTDDHSVVFVTGDAMSHHWLRTDSLVNPASYAVSQLILRFFKDGDWQALPGGEQTDQLPRDYILYLPNDIDLSQPLPLVMVLHGRNLTAQDMVYITALNEIAAAEGFVAVYPNGLQQRWNVFGGMTGRNPSDASVEVDDVDFLTTLVAEIALDFDIDTNRRYVAGFSNGGYMTQRLFCDPASRETFAAYGIIAATVSAELLDFCSTAEAAPVVQIHGTSDSVIPWGPLEISGRLLSLSALDTMRFFAIINRCSDDIDTEEIAPASEDSRVVVFNFRGCAEDYVFYIVEDGGHNWSGVPDTIPAEIAGITNMDINAGQVFWDFFEAHPQVLLQLRNSD